MLFREGVYPYEYMSKREKPNETTLSKKEKFDGNLNMEDTTDAGFMHVKRVCENFEIKGLGEYHDLLYNRDTLFSTDISKNVGECV